MREQDRKRAEELIGLIGIGCFAAGLTLGLILGIAAGVVFC